MKTILSILLSLFVLSTYSQATNTDLSNYIQQPFDKSTAFVFKVPALVGANKMKLLQADTVLNRSITMRFVVDDTEDKLRFVFRNSIDDAGEQLVDQIHVYGTAEISFKLFKNLFPDVAKAFPQVKEIKDNEFAVAAGSNYTARLEQTAQLNGIWVLTISFTKRK